MPLATTRQTKEKGTRDGMREVAKGEEERKMERISIAPDRFISDSRRKNQEAKNGRWSDS